MIRGYMCYIHGYEVRFMSSWHQLYIRLFFMPWYLRSCWMTLPLIIIVRGDMGSWESVHSQQTNFLFVNMTSTALFLSKSQFLILHHWHCLMLASEASCTSGDGYAPQVVDLNVIPSSTWQAFYLCRLGVHPE